MWSNVRACVVVALALTACSDDSKDPARGRSGEDPSGEPGDRDGGSGGDRPNGAVGPMSAACEALHGDTVFQSDAFSTIVRDARASDDGHVVALLDEKTAADAPVQTALRLVHTPGGPARTDIALPGEVLALSDLRGGRMLVVEGDGELYGTSTLDVVDLAVGKVARATPIADLSGAPRVHYDAAGQVLLQVTTQPLRLVHGGASLGATQVAQLSDGAQAVLAFVSDPLPTQGLAVGVWLFVFEADGRHRARAHVKTLRDGPFGGVSLSVGPDDRLHVLTAVHRSERAGFERIHGRSLQTPDFERMPVALTFSAQGVLEGLREAAPADCASPLDATAGALDADAAGLAWTGRCGNKTFLALTGAAADAKVGTTTLTLGTSQYVGSVLRHPSGSVFVAGGRNFAQPGEGSLSGAGDAVLARIEPDGSPSLTCPYDTAQDDLFTLRRSARPLLILQYDADLAQSVSEDARARVVIRYVAP